MKFKWSLAILSLVLTNSIQAQTLTEALHHALATEPNLHSNIHAKKAVEKEVLQAYSGYLPSVSVSVNHGKETSNNSNTRALGVQSLTLHRTDANLTTTQPIFDGFKTRNSVKQSIYKTHSAAYSVQNALQSTALEVITTYLDVLQKQKLAKLAEKNLKEHQDILSKIEKRAESGIGRMADLDQAEGRFALARSNYLATKANLLDAESHYQRVVGAAPKDLQLPKVPEHALPRTEDSAVSIALSIHPSLRSAMMNANAASMAYYAAYSAFLPSVSFQWQDSRTDNVGGVQGQANSDSGLLSVNYVLFNGGADKAKVQQNAESWMSAKNERELAARKIEEQVRISWNAFVTAAQQSKYYKEEADAMARTKDAYQKQFAIGQRTLLDLLDAENELFRSQSDLVASEFKALNSQYQVLNNTGSLLSALQIALPESAEYQDPGVLGAVGSIFR